MVDCRQCQLKLASSQFLRHEASSSMQQAILSVHSYTAELSPKEGKHNKCRKRKNQNKLPTNSLQTQNNVLSRSWRILRRVPTILLFLRQAVAWKMAFVKHMKANSFSSSVLIKLLRRKHILRYITTPHSNESLKSIQNHASVEVDYEA